MKLEKEITRLQEKYDENGFDCSSLIKLKRIESAVDSVIKQKEERIKELEEIGSEMSSKIESYMCGYGTQEAGYKEGRKLVKGWKELIKKP